MKTRNRVKTHQCFWDVNMNERKVLFFILSLIFYCLYSVNMWFMTKNANEKTSDSVKIPKAILNKSEINVSVKIIPLILEDACSVLEVFTKKPERNKTRNSKIQQMDTENNSITVIGITAFLVILLLNALLDVLKVKEEERARRKLNPDGERRKSLAEFANKKILRRESSKFGTQLFQIAESEAPPEEKKSRKETRPYMRGESINSFLSEKSQKTHTETSAPASICETSTDTKLVKRQSVSKLIGARPAPMVRRSSFPVLPRNPDVHALMISHRQSSLDSDEESEGRGRRVRMIRRY